MKRINSFMNSTLSYLGRLICPPSCVCCDKIFDIDDDSCLCTKCSEEILQRLNKHLYKPNDYGEYHLSLLPYSSWYAKRLIAQAKYVSDKAFLNTISKMFYECIKLYNLYKIDLISFTPRRPSQVRLYGFDQAEEMAKALSKLMGIPCVSTLQRKGYSRAQKKMSYEKRAANIKGKFKCIQDVKGKSILLIDDVRTSGNTINACSDLLKQNGAVSVHSITIAGQYKSL